MARKIRWKAHPNKHEDYLKHGVIIFGDKPQCKKCGGVCSEGRYIYVYSNRDTYCKYCKRRYNIPGVNVECTLLRCSFKEIITRDGWNLRKSQTLLGIKSTKKMAAILIQDTNDGVIRILAYNFVSQKMSIVKTTKGLPLETAIDRFNNLQVTSVNNMRIQIGQMHKEELNAIQSRNLEHIERMRQNEVYSNIGQILLERT